MDHSRRNRACTPDIDPPGQQPRFADSPIVIVITIQVFAAFLTFRGYPLEVSLAAACASILIAYNARRVVLSRIA